MNTRTIREMIESTGLAVLTELDHQVEIPLLSGLQRQGDVLVRPVRPGSAAATTPVPTTGTPVVRGENGGNTHEIRSSTFVESEIYCDTFTPTRGSLVVARLTVKHGEAILCHPQHGFNRIAPGSYEIRRQREQADEIRVVQD